jgi:DNA-binding MarR family transcriptional regulator
MKHNFTVRRGALDGVEAFLSVAQHRSFRRAAAELGVTPSAMSQAVRALEARLGAALFIRTTRSVGLTEAGERFLSRARPAFEELVAASGAARDCGEVFKQKGTHTREDAGGEEAQWKSQQQHEAIIDGELRVDNDRDERADREEREICAPSDAVGQMRAYEQANE